MKVIDYFQHGIDLNVGATYCRVFPHIPTFRHKTNFVDTVSASVQNLNQ